MTEKHTLCTLFTLLKELNQISLLQINSKISTPGRLITKYLGSSWRMERRNGNKNSSMRIKLNGVDLPTSLHPCVFNTFGGRDKMNAISQTTFWNAFYWMKIFNFDPNSIEIYSQGPSSLGLIELTYGGLVWRLSKQSWDWWVETPSRSLWRHCNDLHNCVPRLVLCWCTSRISNKIYLIIHRPN